MAAVDKNLILDLESAIFDFQEKLNGSSLTPLAEWILYGGNLSSNLQVRFFRFDVFL